MLDFDKLVDKNNKGNQKKSELPLVFDKVQWMTTFESKFETSCLVKSEIDLSGLRGKKITVDGTKCTCYDVQCGRGNTANVYIFILTL